MTDNGTMADLKAREQKQRYGYLLERYISYSKDK